MISGVPREHIPAVWPHISEYFATFARMSDGEETAGSLLQKVAAGRLQVWVATDEKAIKACLLAELRKNRVVNAAYVAGEDRESWRDDLFHTLKEWAREKGARKLRVVGRQGWKRELKPLGFRLKSVVMEVGLDNE